MSTELAWAAGFFDGEGCTSFHLGQFTDKTKTRRWRGHEIIKISQTSPFVLQRFVEAVGEGGAVKGPYKRTYLKHGDVWSVTFANSAARRVIEKLAQWLSPQKLIQAGLVFERVDEQPARRRGNGRPGESVVA